MTAKVGSVRLAQRWSRLGRFSDRTLIALAGITLGAALLRFSTLSEQSFGIDESYTVSLVRMDFGDMLAGLPKSEAIPPLHYVLAWLWAKLFGTGEVGMRSLSALCGTLTVPVSYLLASKVVSPRAALWTAAIVATNPLLAWYSQEARAYVLLVLLGTLSVLFFVKARAAPTRSLLLLWAVTAALAVATHYFAAFLVAAEGIWLLVAAASRRRAVLMALALPLATGLALIPLVVRQRAQAGAGSPSADSLIIRLARIPAQTLVAYGEREPGKAVAAVLASGLVALSVLLLVSKVRTRRPRDWHGALTMAALGAFSIAAPVGMTIAGVDYVITRYFVVSIVPFAVTVAAGFAVNRLGQVAAVCLVLLSIGVIVAVAARSTLQRPDFRGAASALGPASEPRAVVVTPGVPQVYIRGSRPLPVAGARVRDIAVIGLPGWDAGSPPRSRVEATPPPGFRLSDEREAPTYTLDRYRARKPILVTRRSLIPLRLENRLTGVLLQR
jgi:mannosyltransferase